MKNIIFFLIFAIGFATCKKSDVTYTLSGQIMPCSGYSISTDLQLYQKNNGSNVNAKILATTKPDVNGNFSFIYSTNNTADGVTIRQSSGFGFNNIIEEINVKNIDGLKIYAPKYHLIVNLNVTKPYTSNDTLYLNNYIGPVIKIVGPFVSGRVRSYLNVNLATSINDPFYSGTMHVYPWDINNNLNLNSFFKNYLVPLPTKCNGDSTYITLDIK